MAGMISKGLLLSLLHSLALYDAVYGSIHRTSWTFACFVHPRRRRHSARFAPISAAKDSDDSAAALPDFIETIDYGKINEPSKSDLYSNDELLGLLDLHGSLTAAVPELTSNKSDEKNDVVVDENTASAVDSSALFAPSLQELIEQTVGGDADGESIPKRDDLTTSHAPPPPTVAQFQSSLNVADFQRILPIIRAIASDVDGTLLSSDYTLHPLTRMAIINAVQASFSPMHPLQYFFPATGKTRAGALRSLGPEMQALLSQVPGVYVQGLYCVDATGKVVFEKKLAQIAVEQAMSLAASCGVSLIAYDGDTIYATESSNAEHLNDIHAKWGEPQPQVLDDASMKQYAPGFHKVLLMGDCADEMSYIRPELEALATSLDCVVTQAIPVMLELLPSGCGKAVGVQQLCAHLGLDLQQNVVAIGDAENDLDLLQQAAIGIAVGNAAPAVKDVADVVLVETNNEGGAGRAIELFGLGKVLDLLKE